MNDLERRVRRLEQKHDGDGGLTLIVVRGGFAGNPETAFAGSGRTWQRQPDEGRPEFIERVRAEARAGGESMVTIGGFRD